jgi:hypothetical protein
MTYKPTIIAISSQAFCQTSYLHEDGELHHVATFSTEPCSLHQSLKETPPIRSCTQKEQKIGPSESDMGPGRGKARKTHLGKHVTASVIHGSMPSG